MTDRRSENYPMKGYYSEEARWIAGWALTEKKRGNQDKAAKLHRAAQSTERRNRIYHGDLGSPKCRGITKPTLPVPW